MFYEILLPAIIYHAALLMAGIVMFRRQLMTNRSPWRVAARVLLLQACPAAILLVAFFHQPLVIFSLIIVAAVSAAAVALFFAVSTLIYATST